MPTRKQNTNPQLKNWLLRSLLVIGQRSRLTNSGFVLPTVVMVSLVVVLLTAALIVRSFDRTKNASNARVNQAALNAAAPALDRARAKLDALFEDPNLPRATPADRRLRDVMDDAKYTFPDEVRLKLVADANNNGLAGENSNRSDTNYRLENDETSRQGWKFPVDTDSNGRYDAYTFYSIAWRLPPRNPAGDFTRSRSPLEARTAPMSVANIGGQCATAGGTSASLVGNSGWYSSNGKIVKSFSIYAATVPIAIGDPALADNRYETNNKNKGISVLEVQQDRSRVPLNNNAVLYEDDLDITPGPRFKLNGRIFTNSNLFTTGSQVTFFQVSSQNSCYYTEDNSKIEVGGNIGKGPLVGDFSETGNVGIHLFNGTGVRPDWDAVFAAANQSTTAQPREVAYNSRAYTLRIDFLVRSAQQRATTDDPQEVKDDIIKRQKEDPGLSSEEARRRSLERYFRNRTRRIPYQEVPFGQENTRALKAGATTYTAPTPTVFPTTGPLRPPDEWVFSTNPTTGASFNGLTLNTAQPPGTDTERNREDRKEALLGDRLLLGNGLPATWFNGVKFVGAETEQLVRTASNTVQKWTNRNIIDRTRKTRVTELSDLGDTGRNGFWELSAAQAPEDKLQGVGGLRVVTGAGIYDLNNTFLPAPPDSNPTDDPAPPAAPLATYDDPNTLSKEAYRVVWPDSMPMSRSEDPNTVVIENNLQGHLKMRATAVYHYDIGAYNPDRPTEYQAPIACVSSYYNPSNAQTARNPVGLPDVSGGLDTTVEADGVIDRLYNGDAPGAQPAVGVGKSNNGVSYSVGTTASGISAAPNSLNTATGLFAPEDSNATTPGNLRAKLNYQANLVFPNGRFVNEPLRNALKNLDNGRLSLADQSAIDSTLCALQIANGSLIPSAARIPHGAIKEAAFLDARQVTAIEGRSFEIAAGSSSGNVRTYTVSNLSDVNDNGTLTPRIREGDIVTIQGFTGGGNETLLNVVKGRVTNVTPNASTPPNPSGTIRVTTLVPATISNTTSSRAGITELLTTRSDRAIEDRQPQEVRTTVIDLNRIRRQPVTGTISSALGMQEYLLPNSGIIYATRDDATPDLSEPLPTDPGLTAEQQQATQKLLSPVDYRLDPSRRPHGIMLVNGSRLNRTDNNTYRAEEKGLILATNLPVYVQADTLRGNTAALTGFNLHSSEEFTQKLADTPDWEAEYFYNVRTRLDPEFACRPGTPGLNCSPGDFWRPASVIADAVSLLSNNFALGYRADGDYDLRNNSQDSWNTVKKRRQNGFFDNNFVTSRAFTDADYRGNPDSPPETYRPSSYFNNFITPIQRRVNTHEYLMEMCFKVPVSSCGPTDWWVRPPKTNGVTDLGLKATAAIGVPLRVGTNALDTVHAAGTTSQPAIPEFRQYARRVAFARNVYGALEFTPMVAGGKNEATAIPIGINDAGAIARFPYTGAPPRKQDNTLWYAAVKNVNTVSNAGYGKPGYVPNRTYATDQPLYYLPPEKGGEKLILPDTPEIPGVPSLNGPGNTDPSDYTACIKNSGVSQSYQVTGFPANAKCDDATLETRIQQVRDALGNTTVIPSLGTLTKGTQTLTASRAVNAYDMASGNPSFDPGAKITLVGNSDSIFILRNRSSVEFGRDGQPGVTLDLQGVSPNNVFWVSDGAITFADATAAAPHQLAGNFFGKTDMKVGAYTTIFGGRFLGFSNNSQPIPATSSLTAVTADGQPLIVPVLQNQVTTGSPTDTNDLSTISNNNAVSNNTRWQQRATTSNFNLVIAAGDSPSRVANTADTTNSWIESGGGLHNFPRLLENWTRTKARIAGSFIQLKRSAYATAPFQPVVVATTAGFVQSNSPLTATSVSLFGSDYRQAYRTTNGEIGDDTNWGKHPYYEPPTREWGFDVALLTQLPDLFAQRFAAPVGSRDQFFRQVDRSDAWVQTLLCAAQPQNLSNAQARQSGVAPADTIFVPALQTNNPYRPACTATNADYNRP